VSTDTSTRVISDLPHVNLLPPEISEGKRLRQVQLGGAAAVALAVVVVGALYMTQAADVTKAKQSEAAANAENSTLTTKVASFSRLRDVQASLTAHEAMLTQAMGTEVQWSKYLGDFATLPASTWLKSLTATETVQPGSLASSSQAPPVVATVLLQGTGLKYGNLADFLDRLAKLGEVDGLTNAYFTTATEKYIDSTNVVDFQGSSDLGAAALSNRCAKPGDC
jgi:Tfp pilus assembly protein PilN